MRERAGRGGRCKFCTSSTQFVLPALQATKRRFACQPFCADERLQAFVGRDRHVVCLQSARCWVGYVGYGLDLGLLLAGRELPRIAVLRTTRLHVLSWERPSSNASAPPNGSGLGRSDCMGVVALEHGRGESD